LPALRASSSLDGALVEALVPLLEKAEKVLV
jgi:hypothetical protein